MQGGYPRPSQLLEALRDAEAAHARCKRLLPTVWFSYLETLRPAAHMEEPLRLMVELQDDLLCAPPGPTKATTERRVSAALKLGSQAAIEAHQGVSSDVTVTCSGCMRLTSNLRKCGACK